MKKQYLILFFTFILTLVLVGCGAKPSITLTLKSVDLTVGDTHTIEFSVLDGKKDTEVVATASSDIISLDGFTITAKAAGEATITLMVKGDEKSKQDFNVFVSNNYVTDIEISGEKFLVVGKSIKLEAKIEPEDATIKDVKWSSSNTQIIEVNDEGVAKGIKKGKAKVIASSTDGSEKITEYEISVHDVDTTAPDIYIDGTLTQQDLTLKYNEKFDPKYGVVAMDDEYGDISEDIKIKGRVNTRAMGKYELIYTATDRQGNTSEELKRTIEVVWDSDLLFIGHGGCYSGLMNSAEAFKNAFEKHGYQGIECDVKQTSDGVFVTSHGDDYNGKALNQYTYEEHNKKMLTENRGGKVYTTKLCTFREYLQIAKAHNGFCVVELKYSAGINNGDTSRMDDLMKEIEEEGMLHNVIFLASQIRCLEWVREHGYDYIPCQYLVNNAASDDKIDYCFKNNFDISFNIAYSSNTKEWVDKYHAKGIKVACFTFNQHSDANLLQHYIDMGVDFVTVDKTQPYEVKLPPKRINTEKQFEVLFKDIDGKVLKTENVFEGDPAHAPYVPDKPGYKFIGWDKEFNKINAPLVVTAKYDKANYNITYNANKQITILTAWPTKEAFVNEFYTDWFNWLSKMPGKLEGLTKSGDTYTFALSGETAVWKDVNGLKGLTPSAVERTIGARAYKPIPNGVRKTPTTPVIPEEDNTYFLNTEPYRTKYMGMDEYLIKCIDKAYASYSYNYNQASKGRVQIFFRFHQWCNSPTVRIPSLDNYPEKTEIKDMSSAKVTLPTTHLTFTSDDEFILPNATSDDLVFTGWYLDIACTKKVEKISKGTSGDLVLYAGWKQK